MYRIISRIHGLVSEKFMNYLSWSATTRMTIVPTVSTLHSLTIKTCSDGRGAVRISPTGTRNGLKRFTVAPVSSRASWVLMSQIHMVPQRRARWGLSRVGTGTFKTSTPNPDLRTGDAVFRSCMGAMRRNVAGRSQGKQAELSRLELALTVDMSSDTAVEANEQRTHGRA